MSKRGTNQQSTTSGGSGDGSAPVRGLDELHSGGGARPPRTAHRGERVAGLVTDPTRSPEMDLHNAAARAAVAAHNSGESGGDGPVVDPANLLGGGTSRPVGTCADPSSLSRG